MVRRLETALGSSVQREGEGPRYRWGEALVLPAPVDQLPVEGAAAGLVKALWVAVDVSRKIGGNEAVIIPWGPVVEVFVGSGRDVLLIQSASRRGPRR